LFFVTAGIALSVLISRPFWGTASDQYSAWRLSRQLRDQSLATRQEAATELVKLGPAATSWVIRAMGNRDPVVRELACSIVVQTMPERPDDALAALIVATKDGDPGVRLSAVKQLDHLVGRYGSSSQSGLADQAIRALGEAMSDESQPVRQSAVSSIGMLGPKARSIVKELDQALDNPDKSLRVWAADAMLRVGPDGTRDRVIAVMSSMLRDQSIRLEHYRLVAVLKNAQGAEATAAMLIPLLKNANLETRIMAINDLTTHCTDARALRPAMLAVLDSDDGGIREEAAIYFLEHEPGMASRVIDTVAEQIANPMEGSYFGSDLVKRLRNATSGSTKLLTPRLLELLGRSTKPGKRAFVIAALGEIGPDAAAGVPTLLEISNGTDLDVAMQAIVALVKIDPRTAATKIPALLEWARVGHDRRVRLSAIVALRDFGPAAASAVPALLELADEQDISISAGAIEAISKIDPLTGRDLKQAIEGGRPGSNED
jgi:HEAT repeat protein